MRHEQKYFENAKTELDAILSDGSIYRLNVSVWDDFSSKRVGPADAPAFGVWKWGHVVVRKVSSSMLELSLNKVFGITPVTEALPTLAREYDH